MGISSHVRFCCNFPNIIRRRRWDDLHRRRGRSRRVDRDRPGPNKLSDRSRRNTCAVVYPGPTYRRYQKQNAMSCQDGTSLNSCGAHARSISNNACRVHSHFTLFLNPLTHDTHEVDTELQVDNDTSTVHLLCFSFGVSCQLSRRQTQRGRAM